MHIFEFVSTSVCDVIVCIAVIVFVLIDCIIILQKEK